MKPVLHPRAEELLVERALRPLDDNEHRELDELGAADDDTFDIAAAALAIAVTPRDEMPPHVAAQILASSQLGEARDFKRTLPGVMVAPPQAAHDTIVSMELPAERVEPPNVIDLDARRPRPRSRARAFAPWLAAAACLCIAGGAVWWALQQVPEQAVVAESPAQARAALIASATDLTTIAWTATQDPTAHGAAGDVVWSASQQRGYMRFVGLAPNDRTQFQYQLWIFDKTRDDKFPVDGGVFDVSSTGEVIVPISAKLRVSDLAMFAVTIEKPGGVVVSKRERIVVTATRT